MLMRYPPSFPSHTGAHVINTRLASRLVAPGAAREDEGKGKKQGRTQEEEEVKRKRIITPVWPGGGTSIRGRRTNGWERAQRKQCEHVWQGRGRRRGRQEGEEKGEEEEEEKKGEEEEKESCHLFRQASHAQLAEPRKVRTEQE